MAKCISLSVTMGIINVNVPAQLASTVTYRYNITDDAQELANITPGNAMRVGGAIGKRRLAKENEVVGYPISIDAKFDTVDVPKAHSIPVYDMHPRH